MVSIRGSFAVSFVALSFLLMSGVAQAEVSAATEEAMPPVTAMIPTPEAQSAAPVVQDPCKAYMASYQSYMVCQDRMRKIQRMIEVRDESDKENVAAPMPVAQVVKANAAAKFTAAEFKMPTVSIPTMARSF